MTESSERDAGAGAPSGDAAESEEERRPPAEEALADLGQEVVETSIHPVSTRGVWFFAYDVLLEQAIVSRFIKGMHTGKVARLPNYRLVWPYYHPAYLTALPSLERTNRMEDVVWGLLYDARGKDFKLLERYLRVPNRYHRSIVHVTDRGGRRLPAFTYVLTLRDEEPTRPSAQYRDRLLHAASERNLPEEWLEHLKRIDVEE